MNRTLFQFVMSIKLFKAASYSLSWDRSIREGKTHILDPEINDRTLCGKTPSVIGGCKIEDPHCSATCQGCITAKASREKRERYDAEYAQRELERRKQSEERSLQYQEYLRHSAKWQRLRSLVMKRSCGLCEGCMSKRATQVHHTVYPTVLGEELLFTLVALCGECHLKSHSYYKSITLPTNGHPIAH
jgi:hypothetical protein